MQENGYLVYFDFLIQAELRLFCMNKEYGFEQRVPLNFCNFCGKGKNWAQVII